MHTFRAGAVVAAITVLAGCSRASHKEPVPALGPTLQIVNTSSLVYRVSVSPSLFVQVHPGQHKCIWAGNFNQARRMRVFALASARSHYTPPENLMSAPGWVLEIGEFPRYDVLSLRPAEPCKAARTRRAEHRRSDG